MSEVEARREARRRRILENSGNRLLKISGRTESTTSFVSEEEFRQTCPRRVEICENDSRANENGLRINQMDEGNTLRTMDITDLNRLHAPSYSSDINDTTVLEDILSATDLLNHEVKSHEELHSDAMDEKDTINTPLQPPTKAFAQGTLLFHRLNYVLLAAVANVLLLLQLGESLGKTIAVLYFTMMLGRLYTCGRSRESQNGSLLVAALIMCNMKPDLIYLFKKVILVLTVIFCDLALYIFSFTLMHYGLSYYLHDAPVLV